MPKKKQPRNAFFFFMLDYKARCERNGEIFPGGLRDVQDEAGAEWKVLPQEVKNQYEAKAKAEKTRVKGDLSKKETNLHNTFDSLDRQKMEEEEERNKMMQHIDNTIDTLTNRKSLAEFKFYLIHVNHFCVSDGECYHPAELAISEFCLAEGVTNVYHTIIDPGQIPLGYRHDSHKKSEESHRIQIENNGGERDFYKILKDIKRFLEPGRNANRGRYPPMFTMPDNVILNTSMKAVKSFIEILCGATLDNEDPENYPIYPLDKLFMKLQNACCQFGDEEDLEKKLFKATSIARTELEKDVFNYTTAIACPFHITEDAVTFCSKSYVQRWVYLICDHCIEDLDITVIPGRHLPEHADVNYRRNKELEEEKAVPEPKPFTFIDHSKLNEASGSSWTPREQAPLPRPSTRGTLAAMLPPRQVEPEPIDVSEENFPSISIGRGRGRLVAAQRGRGGPLSFADAMRNKK